MSNKMQFVKKKKKNYIAKIRGLLAFSKTSTGAEVGINIGAINDSYATTSVN